MRIEMDCLQQDDDPCYTCGSDDSKELICSCSRCGDRQHLWCMRPMILDMPSTWLCHECQMQGSSFSATKVCDDVSLLGAPIVTYLQSPRHQKMRMKEPTKGKVKFLPASEAAGLLPGDTRNCLLPMQISVRQRSQHLGKSIPSALRIGSPVKPSAPVRDFSQLTKGLRENREIKGKGKKAADTVKRFTRQGDGSSGKEVPGHEHESTSKVKHKEWAIIKENTKNPINTDAIWSGQFEILDDPDKGVYCRLQAFLPRWVERKAYFFSLSLPSLLSFKLISRNVPWDEMFKDNPPDENDVVFYLLPEFSDRCREPYKHLLDMLDSSDYAMHTCINGVELIVFTSKWLDMTCAESEGRNFLWASYRVLEYIVADKECSIGIQPNAYEEKVEESNIPRNIGAEEVNMVDYMQLDAVNKERTAPQELVVSKESKPSGHEGTRKAIKEELLEFTPGYEAQHWWKNRKA